VRCLAVWVAEQAVIADIGIAEFSAFLVEDRNVIPQEVRRQLVDGYGSATCLALSVRVSRPTIDDDSRVFSSNDEMFVEYQILASQLG
jgi:hypothetical protein